MEKILPIVNVVLSLIAVIVCVIVLMTVGGIKSMMDDTVKTEESTEDPEAIPLSQLEEFNLEEGFILGYIDQDNPNIKYNVVLKLGFALNKDEKGDTEVAKKILTDQGEIIRDRLQNVLKQKDVTYFKDTDKETELKDEILQLMQTLIGNKSIVEVYFRDVIISQK